MALLLALLAQAGSTDWSTDFEGALAKARERELVLCAAVVDDSPASQETLRSFEAGAVRPLVSTFIKVKVSPGSKEAGFLHARWAPTVALFQGRREPPPTPEDQACLKILREKRITVDFEGVPLDIVASYLNEVSKVRFHIHPSIRSVQNGLDFKKADATLADVVRGSAEAVGMDFTVMDGVVVLAAKEKLPEIRLQRDLDLMRAGRIEGLPELGEADRRVTELLLRPIDLDLRRVDRVKDAAARWNAALGEEAVQPTDSMARAFIGDTQFKKCNSFVILDNIETEPKLVWYQKGGKVVLSDKPELVALTPERVRGFIVDSVECVESLLPEGAAREIEGLVTRLGSDDPKARQDAGEALKERVQRSATSRAVLRRLLTATPDAEVRARLNALLAMKRIPSR